MSKTNKETVNKQKVKSSNSSKNANKSKENKHELNVKTKNNQKENKKAVQNKTNQNRKKRNKKRKGKKNKRKLVLIVSTLILLIIISIIAIIAYKKNEEEKIRLSQEQKQQEISSHYNNYVVTNKETDLYKLNDKKYEKVGKIGNEQELTLEVQKITYQSKYLKISSFEEDYYIYYKDVDTIEELSEHNQRYKKYIVFNKNVITKDITNFYDEDKNLIYMLPETFDLPIIVNKKDIYGVEFNNRLMYIKKEDVREIKNNSNTTKSNTKGIAVLNYHFFYDTSISGDAAKCNQSICLSTINLKKHLEYINNNNIFTPSMEELEMYIDGYIQLPKSVVLTIDDGWRAAVGTEVMTEHKINATVFLMSKYYDPKKYRNEYIEVHSHGYDIHNPGICPGGQGGAIKCLEKSKLLEDLKASQDKLDGTTIFCYPFYEYNNYSIKVLKEAGFTMAFGGYGEGGKYRVSPGINKYKLPRYVIYNNTSVDSIKRYIG